jgi:hypothetical protein
MGSIERAASHIEEARRLRMSGAANENAVLRAEAIVSYASGRPAEAAATAQKQVALLSQRTTGSLTEKFWTTEARERLRTYEREANAVASASRQMTPP